MSGSYCHYYSHHAIVVMTVVTTVATENHMTTQAIFSPSTNARCRTPIFKKNLIYFAHRDRLSEYACMCARTCVRVCVCILTQCAKSRHRACSTHAKCGPSTKSRHTRDPLLVLTSDSDSSPLKTQELTIKLWE